MSCLLSREGWSREIEGIKVFYLLKGEHALARIMEIFTLRVLENRIPT